MYELIFNTDLSFLVHHGKLGSGTNYKEKGGHQKRLMRPGKNPHIANIYPSGHYPTEAFWFAGGIPRIQWLLRNYFDLDVITVTGKTLRENLNQLNEEGYFERLEEYLANYGLKREQVIKPVEETTEIGSIALLKGNLAPEGAVIKYASVVEEMMTHTTGPAKVFASEEECH